MVTRKHNGRSPRGARQALTVIPTSETLHVSGASTTTLLLTPEEAAEALRISRTSLYQLLRRGEIPSIRVGRRSRRIPLKALNEWVADQLAAA